MARPEHLEIFQAGLNAWQEWRKANPEIRPDLSGADLRDADFDHWANFRFCNFRNADLSGGRFTYADFRDSDTRYANFTNCRLNKAYWYRADARHAIFVNASFHRGFMSRGNFQGANFTGASLDVRTARDADFTDACLTGFKFETAPYAWDWEVTPIELANAIGLTKVSASSQQDVLEYLYSAYRYAHRDDLEEHGYPHDLQDSLARVRTYLDEYALLSIPEGSPQQLIEVNRDLIAYFSAHPEQLERTDWRSFERLIADLLARHGWRVELTQRTRDGGYDIFGVHTDTLGIAHTWIVECKRWSQNRPVGIDVVRSLYAVKQELRVSGALLATTSHFTKGVKEFKSSRYDLDLRDRGAILEWLGHYRGK